MEKKIKESIDQKFILFKNDVKQEIFKNFPYLEKFLRVKKIWVLIPIALLYLLNITFIIILVNSVIYFPILLIKLIFFDLKFFVLVLFEFIKEYILNWFPLILEILFYFIGIGLYEIFAVLLNFIDYFNILLEDYKWTYVQEIHKQYFLGEPDGLLNKTYKIKFVGNNYMSRWNDIYVSFFDVFSTHFFYYILKIKNIISVLFVWVFYVFIFLYIFLETLFYVIDIYFGIYIPTIFMEWFWFFLIFIYKFFEYVTGDGFDLVCDKIAQFFEVFEYFLSAIKKFLMNGWNELKSIRSFTDAYNIGMRVFEVEWKKHFLTIKNYIFEDFKKFWRSKG